MAGNNKKKNNNKRNNRKKSTAKQQQSAKTSVNQPVLQSSQSSSSSLSLSNQEIINVNKSIKSSKSEMTLPIHKSQSQQSRVMFDQDFIQLATTPSKQNLFANTEDQSVKMIGNVAVELQKKTDQTSSSVVESMAQNQMTSSSQTTAAKTVTTATTLSPEQIQHREMKRALVLDEIISTERNYVSDLTNVVTVSHFNQFFCYILYVELYGWFK